MPSAEEIKLKQLIKEVERLQSEVETATTIQAQKEAIAAVNEELKKAKKYYEDNKGAIVDTGNVLKNNLDTLEKTNNSLQGMLLLNKSITSTFKDMSVETTKFARSTDEWFKKGEELAEQYLSASKSLGISESKSRLLATNFNKSVKESLLLGYTIGEMKDTFDEFAKETGRNRILNSEEVENIAKLSKGAGLYVTEAVKMAEQFDLMGLSSEKVFGPTGYINQAMHEYNQLGINANKVIKTLSSNMGAMQQYSFKNGVKGMIEMSKQAVKMRVEVSEVLSMADKFYQPEAAIEAAANLQLLGGDIAKAFGDPFTIMYEARNKPEELAKRVGQMTENMVSFNEETGEFDFPAEARMQLQSVSKELGMSMESLTEMTRQASKIKSIKMNVSGNILDENMRESIAGMARMKDGKWVVDFEEGGKIITESIEDLTKEQGKLVLDQEKEAKDKTDTDYLREIALYTQTFSKRVENIGESQRYGFAGEMDVYSTVMDSFLKDSLDTYARESQNMMEALTKSFGDGAGFRQVLRDAFVGPGTEPFIEEEFRTIFANMTTAIIESTVGGKLDVATLNSTATDVNIFTDGILDVNDVKFHTGGKTIVSGPAGTFSLNDLDEYYGKDGAFVAGTNLGMDKNITKVTTSNANSNVTVGGSANINLNINSNNPNISYSPEEIAKVKEVIMKTLPSIWNTGNGNPVGAISPTDQKTAISNL
jgi:hypothetical protein